MTIIFFSLCVFRVCVRAVLPVIEACGDAERDNT